MCDAEADVRLNQPRVTTMFNRNKPEVLVVGAGPVGMLAALVLAQNGIRVQIVDRQMGIAAHSYALALHIPTLSLLKEFGMLSEVLSRAYKVRTVAFYTGQARRGEIHLADTGEAYPFVAVLHQSALEEMLEEKLRRLGVRILWNHELAQLEAAEDNVSVTIDRLEKESLGYSVAHTEWVVAKSTTMDVGFVIGADGHDSDVRKAAAIGERHIGAPRHFLVFEFETDADLGGELRLAFEDGSTNVLWPLSDGYCRWSFEVADRAADWDTREKDHFSVQVPGDGGDLLREDNLRRLIQQRAPWFGGSIGDIRWRSHARFDGRMAESFGRGRVWLAGDAAHLTAPAGVQSMNVGLREARELATLITGILRTDTPFEVLHSYNDERIEEWISLHGLNGDFSYDAGTPSWVPALGHELIASIPASGDGLSVLAAQLGVRPRTQVREHAEAL